MENATIFKIAFDGQVFDILADYISFDKQGNRMLLKEKEFNGMDLGKVVANFPLDKSALIEIK